MVLISEPARVLRSKVPRFQPGICETNFERLASWLTKLGCRDMPVGLSVDDTKLHTLLRPYFDANDNSWRLAGVHGGAPAFDSYDGLMQMLSKEEGNEAEKVIHLFVSTATYISM